MNDALRDAAARYADDQNSAEELVRLAAARLSERLLRSGTECSVCGRRFVPERVREDAACSAACRQKKYVSK